MTDYLIPAKPCRTEIEVKRSQFITFIAHTPSIASAKSFINGLKQQFPDARHHCYGYIAGAPDNSNSYGFSDDNEPSGTAGMPIFTHLKHSNLGEITLVVVRYFGGTKLGTGGLARAYSAAAKSALEILTTKLHINMRKLELEFEFPQEAEVRNCIHRVKGEVLDVYYNQKVRLVCLIPEVSELKLPYSVESVDESST